MLIYLCSFLLHWTSKLTNKQTILQIFIPQAFEASASSSGGIQTSINYQKLYSHVPNTQIQKHKHTNTAYDEVPERPNIWYIFEKRIVQRYQRLYSHVSNADRKVSRRHKTNESESVCDRLCVGQRNSQTYLQIEMQK